MNLETIVSQVRYMRRRFCCDFYRICRQRNIMAYIAAVIIVIFLAPTKFKLISSLTSVLKQSEVIGQLEINVTHCNTNREMTAKIVPSYIKTKTGRIYLFSAIIAHIENDQALKHNQTQNITEASPTAIVTGWEHKSGSSYDFKCCFRLKNGMFVSVLSWNKSHWVYFLEDFNLQAKQFKCPINFDIKDISSITILADKNATCPEENVFYISPTIIKHRSPKNIVS
ncbi:uncharacterized protein LOC132724653 [Ruditapes philippinarum]|uniref:uncharacterized protein LOC132724653 n=1 Tax=Ruditapes philippinarum TaxID=129788 RepID=UPI00295BD558|nr:uncharacterized protein LOC132724653 [Ruditapes philippinarum]